MTPTILVILEPSIVKDVPSNEISFLSQPVIELVYHHDQK